MVSATPRQLESLVRLGEALARMRLSPTVESSDVAEALRLMRVRTQPPWGLRPCRQSGPDACCVLWHMFSIHCQQHCPLKDCLAEFTG